MGFDFSLDYSEISTLISDIQRKSDEIEQLLVRLNFITTRLPEDWKGSDATEYIQKMMDYIPSIKKLKEHYLIAMTALQSIKQEISASQSQVIQKIGNELM